MSSKPTTVATFGPFVVEKTGYYNDHRLKDTRTNKTLATTYSKIKDPAKWVASKINQKIKYFDKKLANSMVQIEKFQNDQLLWEEIQKEINTPQYDVQGNLIKNGN